METRGNHKVVICVLELKKNTTLQISETYQTSFHHNYIYIYPKNMIRYMTFKENPESSKFVAISGCGNNQ